jgi:osmoprotectant transport system permease protein
MKPLWLLMLVGSKADVEGAVLGEVFAQSIERTGCCVVERRLNLGGTGIALESLSSGAIDVFPEYSGTLSRTVLEQPSLVNYDDISRAMTVQGYLVSPSLGFNNTYAVGMAKSKAAALGIRTIGDLRAHPSLRGGFTPEFTSGDFGWPGLKQRYQLTQNDIRSMDHRVAYDAVVSGAIDMTDAYTTDAAVAHLNLVTLIDDQQFFDRYEGLALARQTMLTKAPVAWQALVALGGSLDEASMMALNRRVEIDGIDAATVARTWLDGRFPTTTSTVPTTAPPTLWMRIIKLSLEHLLLVLAATVMAVAIGVPLGVMAVRRRRLRAIILQAAGLLQTIPAVALLCLLIPLFGIGRWPAFVAMLLYGLFPVVRGVVTGITTIHEQLQQMMMVLDVPAGPRLRLLELPLARAHIHNGITVCVVSSIGTATLAALIGGGGLGALITEGLALYNTKLILAGAIPAAMMAFVAQWALDRLAPLVDR